MSIIHERTTKRARLIFKNHELSTVATSLEIVDILYSRPYAQAS